MVRKGNFYFGRNLFKFADLFLIPSNLVEAEPYGAGGMSVCQTFFARVTKAVAVHHIERTSNHPALRDCYGIIPVPRQVSLFKKAIFRFFKLLTLPVYTHLAFVVVVTENGRPRGFETFHKIHEARQHTAVVVKLAVDNIR